MTQYFIMDDEAFVMNTLLWRHPSKLCKNPPSFLRLGESTEPLRPEFQRCVSHLSFVFSGSLGGAASSIYTLSENIYTNYVCVCRQ